MSKKKRLSRSIAKHIRKEKARLRREILDLEEYKRKTQKLYKRFEA